MPRKTCIWVTTEFVAYHKWADAPDDVSFLRNLHRHVFKVKVKAKVTHADRQLEFFQVQRKLDLYIDLALREHKFAKSCEMIAHEVLDQFPEFCECEVSEDGENGAVVTVEN